MARLYVCQYCKGKGLDEEMEIVMVGKQKKRYHKFNCYDQYMKDKEFKQQEKRELDELIEVIKQVHGINVIPPQFYSYLQDVRNGNELFGKRGVKKSKQGYRFKYISETYKHCKDSIKWALENKEFNNVMSMLRYTLAIVKNNIYGVVSDIERQQRQEQLIQAKEEQKEHFYQHVSTKQIKYRKSKSRIDASNFLD